MEVVNTDDAPTFDNVPISQGIIHGDTVYVSGQVGVDPDTGAMVDGGVAAQTDQILNNIATILSAADTSLNNVVKATVFIEEMDAFETVNEVYTDYFSEPYPARSAVEVSELAMDFEVEIDVIAAL